MGRFDTKIVGAGVAFDNQRLIAPLRLSSGPITELTQATATVMVEVAGRRGVGRGSIYLSDLWAWPDPELSHDERDRMLRDYCSEIAADLPNLCGPAAHPLELGLRLHARCVDPGAGRRPAACDLTGRSHVPCPGRTRGSAPTGPDACPAMPVLARAAQITDANAAVFDAANGFAGCIPGMHEVLRRQGLFAGTWCLNPSEGMSPGQAEEIDRVYREYPDMNDDEWVRERLGTWNDE